MKKYPAYKDSGLAWLGDIPAHWQISYLKYQTKFINGAPFKPSDWSADGIPIIRIENLNGGKAFNYYKGKLDSKYEIRKGDLMFSWSGNIGTSFGPYLWSGAGLYYLNQHIFKLGDYKYDKKYFYWLLKAVTSFIESKTHGIIGLVHITRQELGKIPVPLIPHSEQLAIVEFLDAKAKEINRFIDNKLRLIELLKEQKTALINRAVLRGINPDVKLKPSGIDWLGDIPKQWESKRAKYFFYEIDERSESGKEELLSVSHITGVTPRSEKNVTMFMAESYEGYKTCKPDDLVINIMWAWMGALGVSRNCGIVSSSYGVYRQKGKNDFTRLISTTCLEQMPMLPNTTAVRQG